MDRNEKVFNLIYERAKAGGDTPTLKEISELCNIHVKYASIAVKALEASKRISTNRMSGRTVMHYIVGEYRTKRKQYAPNTLMTVAEFGGGPIAALSNRDLAEDLMLKVLQGKMTLKEAESIAAR